MEKQKQKKRYEPPKIVRIRLDAQQAILGTCSSSFATASDSGSAGCKAAGCKRWTRTGGIDSGAGT